MGYSAAERRPKEGIIPLTLENSDGKKPPKSPLSGGLPPKACKSGGVPAEGCKPDGGGNKR